MIENKKKNLISRYQNGNYNLTNEDKYLLEHDIELVKEIIKNLPINFEENSNIYYVFEILLLNFKNDYDLLKEEVNKDIYLKSILYQISFEKIISLNLLELYIDMSDFNNEEKHLFERKCLDIKKTKTNFVISKEDFIKLLDKQDYETISKILIVADYDDQIDHEITNRIINEYPFNKYPILFTDLNTKILYDKLFQINTIYSIIYLDYKNDDEVNKVIERLNSGETILNDKELIRKISFKKIFSLDYDKRENLITALFKNNPLIYFNFTAIQFYDINLYIPFIKKQLLNCIEEDTIIPDFVSSDFVILKNDSDIIKKLLETKHYQTLANNFNCIEYFDILYNYVDKWLIEESIESFKNKYSKIKNKRLFKEYLKVEKVIVNISTYLIEKKDMDFLVDEGLDDIVFEILQSKKYKLNDFLLEYSDYFEENIANNVYYITNIIEKNINMISKMSPELFKKIIIMTIGKDNSYYDLLLQIINNQELSNSDMNILFNYLLPSIEKQKEFKISNLLLLKNKFGSNIIKYLKDKTIVKLLKMDYSKLEKFVNLFTDLQYEMKDLENAFDSIIQSKFLEDNTEDIEIFHNLIVYFELKDNRYLNLVDKLALELDSKTLKKNYNIVTDDPKKYILSILSNISNYDENRNKYLDILHQICTYYLDKKRGNYKNKFELGKELNLPYNYETNQLNTALVKICLEDSLNKYKIYNKILEKVSKESNNFMVSIEMIEEAIKFYLGYITKENLSFNIKDIQKLIPHIVKNTTIFLKELSPYRVEYYMEIIGRSNNVKKLYKIDSSFDFYQVLVNLDIDKIEEDILSNSEKYNLFQNIFNKHKINKIPNSLINYLNNNTVFDFSVNSFATFINYFVSIMQDIELDKKRINLATFLKYAAIYDSTSKVFKTILGPEDYKLIKSNPGENAAHKKLKNNQRIKEATEVMIKCFQRQKVTIPTFNEVIELSNNKKIRIVVGNFTNPCNITHGERTGACMRIGGDYENFFNFCYQNENGFHIRFESPDTNKYVSRVSGFRNGNTVFLNELRFSINNDYSNDELLEVIHKVALKLLEYSKKSACPIENVVLHNAYVASKLPITDLRHGNIYEGLPKFETDVNRMAIVVASNNKNGFVPLDFNKMNVPTYLVARDLPKKIASIEDFYKYSSRINAIIQAIKLGSYEYIDDFSLNNGFIYGIVGDDFYCYLDNELNIVEEYVGVDLRCKDELKVAKQELKRYREMLVNNIHKK